MKTRGSGKNLHHAVGNYQIEINGEHADGAKYFYELLKIEGTWKFTQVIYAEGTLFKLK